MDQARIGDILRGIGRDGGEESVRAHFWRKLRRAAGHIPFADEVVAGYYCALDERTPGHVRATLFAALAYFVMPFDAIPDLMAVIGFTDDIAVLTAALASIRPHIRPVHREAARSALRETPAD